MMNKLINRDYYLKKLINVSNTRDIKVITGIRRCGKSKLLEAFKKYIENNIENNNIIHINYALPKNESLMEYHALIDYVEANYKEGASNYILIDEVQMCDGFEKAINGFHAEEKYQIYITGSNAFLLSSDLATLFTGRTFSIEVYPFSLKEYMRYYDIDDPNTAFDKYYIRGGMAGSYDYIEDEDKQIYLKDIFNTLIVQDIEKKYNIKNKNILKNISEFLINNVSSLTNTNNVTSTLNSNNISITNKTVDNYIEYLVNAFAFYKVKRYDIHGKKYLVSNNKYYLADTSFYYAMLGSKNMNFGRIYENIVAIELLRRGYEVYVGKLYEKEVDFVCRKYNEIIYIQVSDDISNEETLKREIEPLLKIKDVYPKMIIARTRQETQDAFGVKIVDLANWLCDGEI